MKLQEAGRLPFLTAAIILPLFLYAPSFWFQFVDIDDWLHIAKNPHLYKPFWQSMGFFWGHAYEGMYVPFSYTVWRMLAWPAWTGTGIWGDQAFNPAIFHFINILLHSINSGLVFFILQRILRSDFPSLIGALVFAVHPIQVESVAWISEMRGLLAWFFVFCALLAGLRSVDLNQGSSNERIGGRHSAPWWAALSVALFLCGILSKPAAIAAPLMFAAVAFCVPGTAKSRVWMLTGIWIVLALPVVFATIGLQGDHGTSLVVPFRNRPLLIMDTIGFYIRQIILPMDLCIDYGRIPLPSFFHGREMLTPVLALLSAVLAILLRKKFSTLFFAGLLFLFGMLPVSGIVPFLFQSTAGVADRYLYGSMLGASLLVAGIAARYPRRACLPVSLVLLAGMCIMTERQLPTWRSTESLYRQALHVNSRSTIALTFFGQKAYEAGALPEARALLERAVSVKLDERSGYYLAMVNKMQGRYEDAWSILRYVAEARPSDSLVQEQAAQVCQSLGRDSLARVYRLRSRHCSRANQESKNPQGGEALPRRLPRTF